MTDRDSPEVKRAKDYMKGGDWTPLPAEAQDGEPATHTFLRNAQRIELERLYEEGGGVADDYVERHMKDLVFKTITVPEEKEEAYCRAFEDVFEQSLDAMMDEREKPTVKEVLEDKELSVNDNAFGVFQICPLPPAMTEKSGDDQHNVTLGVIMRGDVQPVLSAALIQRESRGR